MPKKNIIGDETIPDYKAGGSFNHSDFHASGTMMVRSDRWLASYIERVNVLENSQHNRVQIGVRTTRKKPHYRPGWLIRNYGAWVRSCYKK